MHEGLIETPRTRTHVLASWREWKERCALTLCAAETQHALLDFLFPRFMRYVQRYAHRVNVSAEKLTLPSRDAWHLFESHVSLSAHRKGKRYKEWLFARASGGDEAVLRGVESGVSLLVRDVVREYLRRECSPAQTVSFADSHMGGCSTGTLETLLPGSVDPAHETARREFIDLAEAEAAAFVETLSRREKVALLARRLCLSVTNPVVMNLAGCGKSALSKAYRTVFFRLSDTIRNRFAQEDEKVLCMLCIHTFDRITELVQHEAGDDAGVFAELVKSA
jgi:hypothetical protein